MNAAEDGYVIDFDWQLDADRWMDRYMRENPDFIKRNGYHIVMRKSFTATDELANEAVAALEAANARISELEAARIAYANEFPPDAEGHPDVGNVHANIRAMKGDLMVAKEYREVIAAVCEGFTLPDAVRKILETALWNPGELKGEGS
ncbi:hypothetical protein [Paraburkholderia youngii]|uniref:hypothetical protein n=1 Tax=Paraburkholderia youngii TaxID=2782701 RepID=UPI003D207C44